MNEKTYPHCKRCWEDHGTPVPARFGTEFDEALCEECFLEYIDDFFVEPELFLDEILGKYGGSMKKWLAGYTAVECTCGATTWIEYKDGSSPCWACNKTLKIGGKQHE